MSHQTKIIQNFQIALIMLIIILMQCACDKEDPQDRKEFINNLIGEWHVSHVERLSVSGTNSDKLIIQGSPESLFYIEYHGYNIDTTIVSLNDPNLCTQPEIEKMCRWTITENKKDLLLETEDLCGIIKNYNIEYENIEISNDWDWSCMCFYEDIKADIKFVGMDTSITVKNFKISDGYTLEYYIAAFKYRYGYFMIR